MRVLVTGGTGFVGSHIVLSLLDAGHDVRLLVRRPGQVGRTFAAHDRAISDVVVGDVLDAEAVRTSMEGCDAVVHAAAVYSLDRRRADEMASTNAIAAEIVLGAAVEQHCDPIVHVSSTVALTRHGGSGPDLPLGDIDRPYCRSKVASEEIARRLQASGAPVVTIYPGQVYGPHDPYLGEQTQRLAWIVPGMFPLWPTGGNHCVDVRDVAATVAAVIEPGRGPRRYVVPGHHVTGDGLYSAVSTAIGRRRPHVTMPRVLGSTSTGSMEAVQRHFPAKWRHYPADPEGIEIIHRDTRFDTTAAESELGVHALPFDDSVRDTIAWMVDAGHLKEKYRPR